MSTPPATGEKRAADEPRVTHLRHRDHARREQWQAEHARAERFRKRLRWLLLGDWTPVLRDPLDLWRLSFAVAAVVLFLGGNVDYGVRFTMAFLVLVLAWRLRIPRLFDALFLVGMSLSLWGSYFNLFQTANYCYPDIKIGKVNHLCVGYDKLVHLVLPTSAVPLLYILALRLDLLPDLAEETDLRQRLGLIMFAVMAVVCVVSIYEIYEYVNVFWFESTTMHIGFSDTIMDLVNGVIAGVLGGVILWRWALKTLAHRAPAAVPVTKLLNLLKLGFLAWAVVELAQGHIGYAISLTVTFAILQVPRLLKLPWAFDAAFLIAWTLQSLGQVAGLFHTFSWWHILVHVSLPSVLAPMALVLFIRWRLLPDIARDGRVRQPVAIVLQVFLIATAFGALYETWEWISDVNFGTHYDPTKAHVEWDIAANAMGGLIGGLWLAAWNQHGAKRRSPRAEKAPRRTRTNQARPARTYSRQA